MSRKVQSEESSKSEGDPSPDFDREYESVTSIQDRMEAARDDWEPPEKPTYESHKSNKPTMKTGIVRSIDE